MSRLGTFSLKAYPATWFNDLATPAGWLPQDVVPLLAIVPPPPPPPPPTPVRPRPSKVTGSGGGGGAISVPYCPPEWLQRLCGDYSPVVDGSSDTVVDKEADYALLYLPDGPVGAPVRALAAGEVERVTDGRGRTSVVLTADDGTRYWYADLGRVDVADGSRVEVDQVIARTKPGARPIPTVVRASASTEEPTESAPVGALPAGSPGQEPRPKPAQVVFVEAPPVEEPAPTPRIEPPSNPTPVQSRVVVWRLLPKPGPRPDPPVSTIGRASIRSTILSLSLVAALLSAAYLFDRSKRPKRKLRQSVQRRRPGRRRS